MRASLSCVVLAASLLGCSSGSTQPASDTSEGGSTVQQGSPSGPCDPLAPSPTTLGTVIGVGKDGQETLYVADTSSAGQLRVFVSSGGTLVRKDVVGSGQMGSPPMLTKYTLSYRDAFADIATARNLLINWADGQATEMALGSGNPKAFLGSGTNGDETLTVEAASTVAGMPIQNLPHVPVYVADASDGTGLVVTTSMDAYGTDDAHLYYGTAAQMIERPITAYNASLSGDTTITFGVDAATYSVHFSIVLGDPDASPDGSPGPVTLDKGGTTEMMTLRLPTPTMLPGFTFTCTGS